MSIVYQLIDIMEFWFFDVLWGLQGHRLPSVEEQKLICENVTFIYKSFQRQRLAKRLYYSIQKYYPNVKVIICDDSREPLTMSGENLQIIRLPFNSGLSYGLQVALDNVSTPFVIRMDDDQMLTRRTNFHKQLGLLLHHSEIDLVGVLQFTTPLPRKPEYAANEFLSSQIHLIKDLILPHGLQLDDVHFVVGKCSNVFVARTCKLKQVGYDRNIRMIDHQDFFIRAAGIIVSVIDTSCLVHHSHNRFHKEYEYYRSDIEGDLDYISKRGFTL